VAKALPPRSPRRCCSALPIAATIFPCVGAQGVERGPPQQRHRRLYDLPLRRPLRSGVLLISNAAQLPPYRNGAEIEIPSGLPSELNRPPSTPNRLFISLRAIRSRSYPTASSRRATPWASSSVSSALANSALARLSKSPRRPSSSASRMTQRCSRSLWRPSASHNPPSLRPDTAPADKLSRKEFTPHHG